MKTGRADLKKSVLIFLMVSLLPVFIFNGCKKNYDDFCEKAHEYLVDSNFQGTVLVAKGEKIIFEKSYGPADEKKKDSENLTAETIYEIGSLTKQMTAAAIMQQVEKKKISLEDTLDKYFPEYENGNQISIRMLLNMRSGLVDHINSPDEFFSAKKYKIILRNDVKSIGRDFVLDSLNTAPMLTKPDSTYFYCNTNYYLLARILEQVSGMSYEDYMQKNIFEKAGMKTANLEYQKTDAKGYYKNSYTSIPKNLALGCGDVNASVYDVLAWNNALVKGKVVTKDSFNQMINTDSYGFGLYCTDKSLMHSGSTVVFNSYNEYFLKEKITIVVLSNKPQSAQNATLVAGKIKKLLF